MPHPSDPGAPDIIGMAAGAIGELTPDAAPPAGSVEILCRVLKHASEPRQDPSRDRPGPAVRSATVDPVENQRQFQMAEAIWSLGILGRASAPAMPLLLTTFEALPDSESPDDLRGLTAEALAAIARETPDEDRVLASLAKAWNTAPPKSKVAMTRRSGASARRRISSSRHSPDSPPMGRDPESGPFDIPGPGTGSPSGKSKHASHVG